MCDDKLRPPNATPPDAVRGWHIDERFMPAASPAALKAMSRTIRRWALHHRSDKALQDLAAMYNPCIRGWINYYGQFYHTQLRPTLTRIDAYVTRWARGFAINRKAPEIGLSGFAAPLQHSSLIGSYAMATAEHREPCESRGSCTVLGARRGEIPPRDSTKTGSCAPCALGPLFLGGLNQSTQHFILKRRWSVW